MRVGVVQTWSHSAATQIDRIDSRTGRFPRFGVAADRGDLAAANRYRLDPLLLYAIAQVESNLDLAARNVNRNGTRDIGLMQINSIHLPRLAKYGVTERRLREDACTSIITGAWILAGFVQQFGYGWEAVGAYNAGTGQTRASLRKRYADKVRKRYAILVAERNRRLAQSAVAHRP